MAKNLHYLFGMYWNFSLWKNNISADDFATENAILSKICIFEKIFFYLSLHIKKSSVAGWKACRANTVYLSEFDYMTYVHSVIVHQPE